MQYTLIATLLAASVVNANSNNIFKRQSEASSDGGNSSSSYLAGVCMPVNATDFPDLSAPCNAFSALTTECMYGPDAFLELLHNATTQGADDPDNSDDGQQMQSNVTQRACACESQFWPQLQGCMSCYQKHGGQLGSDYFPQAYIASMSSAYCAASSTPTAGLDEFLFEWTQEKVPSSILSAATASATSSFHDPIGNNTAVLSYFTPSVTGSAAWVAAEATATGTGSSAGQITSLNTVSGQIVPTASAASVASGSASGNSTSSGSGAMETAATGSFASVVGIAALVALL